MVKIGKLDFLDVVAIVGFYALLTIAMFTDCLATNAKIDSVSPVPANVPIISLPAWANLPTDVNCG
jgi:hypothetical protein